MFKTKKNSASDNVSKGVYRFAVLNISKLKSLLPFNMTRIITKNYLLSLIASHIVFYPSPISLTTSIKLFYRILLCPLLRFLSLYGLLTIYLTPINKYDF